MSGLRKAKHYDWKDSNLALFGSDLEKNVKKESAGKEKAWQGAGEKVGLQIWRIVQFKVTDWPKEDYGKFYSGDSYIILNTYKDKESDELLYDVHFWIGKESTQDEYGTAAYKTVELDTLLNDKPVQHREVMNNESDLFASYFETISLLKGGAKTGFNRVGPKDYKPRLLKFDDKGRNQVEMTEVAYVKESITPDNVYIIDNGLTIYQMMLRFCPVSCTMYPEPKRGELGTKPVSMDKVLVIWAGVNGSQCDKDEKFKAAQYVMQLKSERGGAKSEVLGDNFQTKVKLPSGEVDSEDPTDDDFEPTIKKLSDAKGHLEMSDTDSFSKDVLDSNDVFVVDTGKQCFIWVGEKASVDERRKAMQYAHNYLLTTKHPLVPVTVVKEGQSSKDFDAVF